MVKLINVSEQAIQPAVGKLIVTNELGIHGIITEMDPDRNIMFVALEEEVGIAKPGWILHSCHCEYTVLPATSVLTLEQD